MNLLERTIDIIAPHHCLVCDREGSLLCHWCLPDAMLAVPDRCYRCFKSSPDSRVCEKCRRESRLKHVRVVTEYDGVAKELLHKLKFGRARAAASTIAEIMTDTLPYQPNTIICHIPAATSRRRARGYDQAQEIARHLSALTQMPNINLLARIGQGRQLGSSRAERLRQIKGVFRAIHPKSIDKAHILLVDDVVTTGATIEEAAKILKQAGAKTVNAIIFAQKR